MPLSTSFDFSAPTSLDVILRAGVGGELTVQVTQGGTPVDLTGASIRYVANTSPQIIKTVGAGIAIDLPETNGTFTITYTAADTTAHNSDQGKEHECKLQQLAGVPLAVFEGKLMIEPSLFTTV